MKDITEFGNAVSQWAPWLVMAFILLVYMRQQAASDKTKNDNVTQLIKTIGTIQTDSDNTRRDVQELAEKTDENTQVIQVFSQAQRDFKGSLDKVDNTLIAFDKHIEKISETYVSTTNDHSAGLQAVGERLIGRMDATKVDIVTKVDGVPIAVVDKLAPRFDEHQSGLNALFTLIQTQISDLTTARDAWRTRAETAERRLSDFQAVNAGISTDPDPTDPLAKLPVSEFKLKTDPVANRNELDAASKPDDPEPPTPGTKAPLPFEKPSEPVLGKTGTEGL